MTDPSGTKQLVPFLQGCVDQALTSQEWFARVILPLSINQLRWRPRNDAWCVAECLDHLNRVLLYYLPKVEEAIARNSREPATPANPLLLSRSERQFLEEFEPPVQNALQTHPALSPTSPGDPERLVDDFPQLRERYANAVLAAASLNPAHISITGSMHFPVASLGGIIALLAVHDRRHLWQAQQIRIARGFPGWPAGLESGRAR